jgi:hypothetical protein
VTKIQTSVIDLSALPDWPHYPLAAADMHRQLDRHDRLRQIMGAALAPPECGVHSLGGRLILISRVEIS